MTEQFLEETVNLRNMSLKIIKRYLLHGILRDLKVTILGAV